MFKSSGKNLWPILANFEHFPPFLVGLFSGTSKPTSVADYLRDFVEEVQRLRNTPVHIHFEDIHTEDIDVQVNIVCLICDAAARSWLKGVPGSREVSLVQLQTSNIMPRGQQGKKQGKGSPPKKPSTRKSDRLAAPKNRYAALVIKVPTSKGNVDTLIAVPVSWVIGSQAGGDLRVWLPWATEDSESSTAILTSQEAKDKWPWPLEIDVEIFHPVRIEKIIDSCGMSFPPPLRINSGQFFLFLTFP
jgi:hypothetical protein